MARKPRDYDDFDEPETVDRFELSFDEARAIADILVYENRAARDRFASDIYRAYQE